MSVHGLKVIGADDKVKILTPDDGTVIAAGSISMSNSLEGDNTYGEDIALGDTYDEDEISVLVVPRRPTYAVTYNRYIDTTLYYNTFYLDSASGTYYTRNPATGVMTSFSAGNKTVNVKTTWDPILSVFPIAFWDKKGASTFSSVRLFAATGYLIRDPGADTNLCLAGSASGSGGFGGGNGNTVNNIKDGNAATWYGQLCQVAPGNSCAFDYSCEVSFASATIFKVDSLQQEWATAPGGNYAEGSWYIQLYYNAQWNTVYSGSFSAETYNESILRTVTGHWTGVTGIKAGGTFSAQGGGDWALVIGAVFELRAWGSRATNDSENKIVYSIGNKGIDTVDYMVCRKRFIG